MLIALSLSPMALEARLKTGLDIVKEREHWNNLLNDTRGKSTEEARIEAKNQLYKTAAAVGKIVTAPVQDGLKVFDAYYDFKKEWEQLKYVLEMYWFCSHKS